MAETVIRKEQVGLPQNTSYYFRAYTTTVQAFSTGTTTVVEYDLESYDPNSNYDTTNDRYQIPASGVYVFTAGVRWDNMPNDKYYYILIRRAGTAVAFNYYNTGTTGGVQDTHTQVSYVGYFAKDEYVDVQAHQASGGDLSTNPAETNTFLSGACIFTT
jgi:hypothetical protein